MKQSGKWKKTGVLLLAAAVWGSLGAVPGGSIKALGAQEKEKTEYSGAELERFQDNTLEYWEIPGLIEQYNPDYRNQLEQFYGNPGGSTGLTKEQMETLAADLRAEAENLEAEAEDQKDEVSKKIYEAYKANVRSLKAYAKRLEDAAEGKTAAGSAAFRGLRILKNDLTKTARESMREYETLRAETETANKKLEAAELALAGAGRQRDLGIYSEEQLLAAREQADAARAEALKAEAAEKKSRQALIPMLGWNYDGQPEILAVPEPETGKIAEFHLDADTAKAIENNYGLYDIRMASSKSQGGVDEKARKIKETEEQITSSMDLLYKEVIQKQTAYEAAATLHTAAKAEKEAADRKLALGMVSRQEYLEAEGKWLENDAAFLEAGLSLTGAMENYQWAVEGLLETEGTGNSGQGNGGGLG